MLLYPEEKAGFILPTAYRSVLTEKNSNVTSTATSYSSTPDPHPQEHTTIGSEPALGPGQPHSIVSHATADGTILVGWYSTDDPANPQSWSNSKRALVACLICFYTFAVYTGSAIYVSSELGVIKAFDVSSQQAALPLSLYVLAYGIGPLLFAPLSELPSVGRNPVYTVTFILFVILCVPTAMVDSFGGLLALRFFQGFFGSPCLANGGASMQDLYSDFNIPFAMTVWVSAAYCGPALGPLLSGFAVTAKGWRWSLWEVLWVCKPTDLTQSQANRFPARWPSMYCFVALPCGDSCAYDSSTPSSAATKDHWVKPP